MSEPRVMHECPESAASDGFGILASCAGETSTGVVVAMILGLVAVMALVGWLLWRRARLNRLIEDE